MCRELFSPVSIADVGDFLRFRFSSHVEFRHVFDFSKAEIVDRLTAPYRNIRLRLILFSKEDKLRTLLKFKRFQGNSEFDPAFPIAKKCLIVCDFPHPTWCCRGWTVR